MDYLVWIVIIFFIGFYIGKNYRTNPNKKKKYYNFSANKRTNINEYEPIVSKKATINTKVFKDSRWEDKNDLFWGMIENGVIVTGKDYLTTVTERKYYNNLINWFDKNCSIHCQVSLGRLFILPEQDDFTSEERRRFFSIYNHMSLDFVLISKFNNKVICVIELDDKTHEEETRKERDQILDCLLEKTGIPYLHILVENIDEKPPIWEVRKNTKEKYQEQQISTINTASQ